MLNKIKENKILISVMLFFTILIFTIHFNYVSAIQNEKEISDKKIEILESEKSALENKKSKLDIIKAQIEEATDEIKYNKEKRELYKKIDEANIWYIKCLEAEGLLEIKGGEYNLECYAYLEDINGFHEETYTELERFASYNLDKTLTELGLK